MGNSQQTLIMSSLNSSPDNERTSLLETDKNMGTSKSTASSTEITISTSDNSGSSSSNDEESQYSDEVMEKRHAWLLPFFVNIFLACASFSIVMPSLSPYLLEVGASMSYLPWAVASYSVGEMIGSIAIGSFYEFATHTFALGVGPRYSMIMCIFFGLVGSGLYTAAGWVESSSMAEFFIVAGRFLQGVWTGGQQAIEQAYVSAAIEPSKRVEFTATLSTCAVLGFVAGPTIGALLSIIDTTVLGLKVGANNAPGLFILLANLIMLIQTALFFDGKDDCTGESGKEADEEEQVDSSEGNSDHKPFNYMGVAVSMFLFYIHYYSFAVQETIITPLCSVLYDWDPIEVNLLFTCAGVLSLIVSFAVRLLARYVEDRVLLVASILIGFLGSAFLMDSPFSPDLPIWRFLVGFSLVTVAFPIGRNVVLGIFGNVLGPVNQGRWMGVMVAISAFPRVVGPFIAFELLEMVKWKTWLEFGLCTALFGMVLALVMQNIDLLVPYEDFLDGFDKEVKRMGRNQLQDMHSPIPSPIIGRSPVVRKR
jgi:MFS family permease